MSLKQLLNFILIALSLTNDTNESFLLDLPSYSLSASINNEYHSGPSIRFISNVPPNCDGKHFGDKY